MAIDTEERAALVDAIRDAASGGPRDFLDERGKPHRDERLWKLLIDQLGMAGLLVAEQDGGVGAGVAEAALLLEQLARSLAVVPALSSIGAASALLRVVGTPPASALLQRLAAGTVTTTVAWPSPESYSAAPVLVANGTADVGETVTITGCTRFVLDGMDVDVILVPADCDGTAMVVAIDATDPSVRRSAMDSLDLTRGLAAVEFTGTPGTVLGADVDVQAALDLTLVLIAAEQVGIAQFCHDAAVAWAKERVQFDRPIGQFQAIKHQLVDLLMAVELARSSLDVAIEAGDVYLGEPGPEAARALSIAASVAKARCGEAATLVADESLHIFGGIGFTWEHDAHLYFRRAKTLEVLLGNPASHRRRFAGVLLEATARV